MADFWKDEELQELGERIAEEFHSEKLASANFLFVFRDPPQKRGTVPLAGTASKVPKVWKDVGAVTEDFLIQISKEAWDALGAMEKRALLDHELSHCDVDVQEDGSVKLRLIPHDVEDFITIYERYGAWQEGLKRFEERARQEERE